MSVRRRQPPPPPKKSKTGLIVGIIIAVIVLIIIIVVIILVIRSRSSSGGGGGGGTTTCTTNADCTGARVCNTATGSCVECLSNANCADPTGTCDTSTKTCVGCLSSADCSGSTPACYVPGKTCVQCLTSADCTTGTATVCNTATRTCVEPECNVNADCTTDPSKTVCNVDHCVACVTSPDCAGNPYYNADGKNTCASGQCVECSINADCGSGTCNAGVCCNLFAPVFNTLNPVTAASRSMTGLTLTGSYTPGPGGPVTFDPATEKIVARITAANGDELFVTPTSSAPSANGSLTVVIPTASVTFFNQGGISYGISLAIAKACGTSSFSNVKTFTVPSQRNARQANNPSSLFPITEVNILSPATGSLNASTGFTIVMGCNPDPCSPESDSKIAMAISKNPASQIFTSPNSSLPVSDGILVRNVKAVNDPIGPKPSNGSLYDVGQYKIDSSVTGSAFWNTLNVNPTVLYITAWYEQGSSDSLPGPSLKTQLWTMTLS